MIIELLITNSQFKNKLQDLSSKAADTTNKTVDKLNPNGKSVNY